MFSVFTFHSLEDLVWASCSVTTGSTGDPGEQHLCITAQSSRLTGIAGQSLQICQDGDCAVSLEDPFWCLTPLIVNSLLSLFSYLCLHTFLVSGNLFGVAGLPVIFKLGNRQCFLPPQRFVHFPAVSFRWDITCVQGRRVIP